VIVSSPRRVASTHVRAATVCPAGISDVLAHAASRSADYESVVVPRKTYLESSMLGVRKIGDITRSTIAACAGLLIFSFARTMSAQTEEWTPPHPMLLTAERALSMVLAADRKLAYVPGEVLVRFRAGVNSTGQQRALMALRSRPAPSDLRWVGDVALLSDRSERDATILAAQLRAQPEVESAEPNYLYRISATPNDPGFMQRQWNLTALDMPRAWDINPGANDSIIAAVLDTGVTAVNRSYSFQSWNGRALQNVFVPFAMNPDVKGSRIVTPKDFVFWDGPVVDMHGHGTHVAATIGEETNNGVAEAGIAYRVKLMPVKVCVGYWEVQFALSASGYRGSVPADTGGCPTSEVAAGIRYAADNGAKVINLSLGGPEPSGLLRDALAYAVDRGAFVAIAMGNEYEDGNPVEYPAAYAAELDGVMSVGAVGPSLTRSFYSNTGSHLEISAPGGSDRDGGASGLIWQATILRSDSNPASVASPRFDRYAETGFQGTSMATPHVAGVAALLISQGLSNPAAVEAVIRKTARALGTADGDTPGRNREYGFGLIQPRSALRAFGIAE
jgi:serine protease